MNMMKSAATPAPNSIQSQSIIFLKIFPVITTRFEQYLAKITQNRDTGYPFSSFYTILYKVMNSMDWCWLFIRNFGIC